MIVEGHVAGRTLDIGGVQRGNDGFLVGGAGVLDGLRHDLHRVIAQRVEQGRGRAGLGREALDEGLRHVAGGVEGEGAGVVAVCQQADVVAHLAVHAGEAVRSDERRLIQARVEHLREHDGQLLRVLGGVDHVRLGIGDLADLRGVVRLAGDADLHSDDLQADLSRLGGEGLVQAEGVVVGVVIEDGDGLGAQVVLAELGRDARLIRIEEAGTEHVVARIGDLIRGGGGGDGRNAGLGSLVEDRDGRRGGHGAHERDDVLAHELVEHAHGVGRIALIVTPDELNLLAEHAAVRVDLVHGVVDARLNGQAVHGDSAGQRRQAADLHGVLSHSAAGRHEHDERERSHKKLLHGKSPCRSPEGAGFSFSTGKKCLPEADMAYYTANFSEKQGIYNHFASTCA